MAGKGNNTRRGKADQAVKSVRKEIKALEKEQRRLLKQAGSSVREFRKELARLKKLGVISKRKDIRSQPVTKYYRQKLSKFRDVLSGDAVPVKASKQTRKSYKDIHSLKTSGAYIIVPKQSEDMIAYIEKDMIRTKRSVGPLKQGEVEEVILPYRPVEFEQLLNQMADDPTLDGLKQPDELFAFRFGGHNQQTFGFPDYKELTDYVLKNYNHLFNKTIDGRPSVEYLMFYRFKNKSSILPEDETADKLYSDGRGRYAPVNAKGRNESGRSYTKQRAMERAAIRASERRKRETKEEREKRILYQREYARQKRETPKDKFRKK